jgi:large subunit ribosomal protein L20
MAKGAKTFKGIAKRVRTTATGKLMHGRPFSNHFMSKKRASRKRTFAHMQHGRRRSYRLGKQAVTKALQYATRDRRTRKRDFRSLWITRINNAVREHGLTYGGFINTLKKASIDLDRKTLSELAVNHPATFKALVEKLK